MNTNHGTTTSSSNANAESGQQPQLPALVQKARTQIQEFLKDGAHVLCPLEVTDPPIGYYPKVVVAQINPDPRAKEVYVKEAGYVNKPAQLELSKIALMKLADTIGVTWDEERSRRTDDGRNPSQVTYKAVGYIEDYLGNRRTIEGSKTIDLDAIRDDLVNTKTRIAEAYQSKMGMGTQYEKDVPSKWKQAITEGTVAEFIAAQVRDELIKKRLFMYELAETGAKLRAIRNKGVRTTYTAQELQKPFVDVRMMPLHPTPASRHRAEQAYSRMYGAPPQPEPSPPPPRQASPPQDDVIDATSRWEPEVMPDAAAVRPTSDAEPSPSASLEGDLADFEAMDPAERLVVLQQVAAKKGFPLPKEHPGWGAQKLRPIFKMLLEMPDAPAAGRSTTPQQPNMFSGQKGGRS